MLSIHLQTTITSIRNKSVIVTGGTKGIGKGIAGVLTKLGARVGVIGRNEHDGAAAVAALSSGGTAIFCRGDVKKQQDMEEAVATVAAAFGGVDILCANAGVFPPTPLEEMRESAWDDVFATNLKWNWPDEMRHIWEALSPHPSCTDKRLKLKL